MAYWGILVEEIIVLQSWWIENIFKIAETLTYTLATNVNINHTLEMGCLDASHWYNDNIFKLKAFADDKFNVAKQWFLL